MTNAGVAAPTQQLSVSSVCTQREWNGYVAAHPLGTVDHLWEWSGIFQDVFRQTPRYLVARHGDAIVGVLPLVLFRSILFGRSVISLPMLNYGGVLADDEAAQAALIEEAGRLGRDFRARFVELRHQARLTSLPSRDHKVSVRLSLPASVELLWDGLDRKVRNQVRKAQKSELTVESGGAALVDAFYQVFAENMRDLGTPVYPRRLFAAVVERLAAAATVHLVRHRGAPVAGGITLAHEGVVLVPWASSLRSYRALCPNMLLYWSMLESAVAARARVFDFGRSSRDASTLAFKLQWGATEAPQFWEYVLLSGDEPPEHGPSNPKFSAAIRLWQRLPLAIANAAGPALVRHVP
jgi:serine/alanine adding enzyme